MEPDNIKYIRSLRDEYYRQKKDKKAIEFAKKTVQSMQNKLSATQDIKSFQIELAEDIQKLYLIQKDSKFNIISQIDIKRYSKIFNFLRKEDFLQYLKINTLLAEVYARKKNYLLAISIYKNIFDEYDEYEEKIKFKDNNKIRIEDRWIKNQYLQCSRYQLLLQDYKGAIKTLNQGMKIGFNSNFLQYFELNIAHAYLLSEQFNKAEEIYIKNIGIFMNDDYNVTWNDMVFKHFKIFRQRGIKNKNLIKIEKLLKKFLPKRYPIISKLKNNKLNFYINDKLCFQSGLVPPPYEKLLEFCPQPKGNP